MPSKQSVRDMWVRRPDGREPVHSAAGEWYFAETAGVRSADFSPEKAGEGSSEGYAEGADKAHCSNRTVDLWLKESRP